MNFCIPHLVRTAALAFGLALLTAPAIQAAEKAAAHEHSPGATVPVPESARGADLKLVPKKT